MRPACRWRTSSALAAAALLAACTSSEPRSRDDARGPGRPRDGAVLTVVVVGDPVTLDPYGRRATSLTRALARPVYRSLYRLDRDGRPVEDLVETLEARGRRAVATLEKGPLTSRDVAASALRARAPSGLAGLEVRRLGPRRVEFVGPRRAWPHRLARGTWVLPRGRATGEGGGPYRVARHTPGFETVLAARGQGTRTPMIERVRIRLAAETRTALRLVAEGDAHAGWIPSSVNLGERAAAAGLLHAGAIGWESVALDFRASALSIAERAWVTGAAGRERLGGGLVGDEGEVARAPVPPGGIRPRSVFLTAPTEDELLVLLLRAIQRRLSGRGVAAEAVSVTAGDPSIPGAVRLIRVLGAPGARSGEFPATWPLFRIQSTLVWRDGLSGPDPNPTLDGPLWNLEAWRLERPL